MSAEARRENYWVDTCQALTDTTPPTAPDSVDVVVVGTGVTGLVAALTLARAGLSVLALDKAGIGSGASARNAGIMVLGYKSSPTAMTRRFGLEATIALHRMSLDAFDFVVSMINEENIDCDYVEGGHLEAAARATHLRGMEETRVFFSEHLGHHLDAVSAGDMTSHLQSERYFGGSFDPRGRTLHPGKYTQGLARRARDAGVVLCPNTPVTKLQRTGGGFAVTLGSRTVDADKVVMATNAYTDRAAPWLQRRIVAVGSHMVATREIREDVAHALIRGQISVSDSKRFLYYFRLSPDGKRLLFGARTRFSPASGPRDVRGLRQSMVEVFPQLVDVEVEYAWSGQVGFTRDFLPHLGSYGGICYAVGYNGGGVAMGSYLGARLADAVLGREAPGLPVDDRPFRPFPQIRGWPWFLPAAHVYHKILDFFGR